MPCAEMPEKITCKRQRDDPRQAWASDSMILAVSGKWKGDFVEIEVWLANEGIAAVAALFSIGL